MMAYGAHFMVHVVLMEVWEPRPLLDCLVLTKSLRAYISADDINPASSKIYYKVNGSNTLVRAHLFLKVCDAGPPKAVRKMFGYCFPQPVTIYHFNK